MRKVYFLLVTVFFLLIGSQRSFGQYCSVAFSNAVEPITSVAFGTINNATSATLNGTPALENFTAITTNAIKSQSYSIVVKGNTDGNFTDHIYVYFDWNHDNDFTDSGEEFYVGSITNSTGAPAATEQATTNILIPAGATDGNTRMRVVKKWFSGTPTPGLSCNTTGYGQAEDYTVNVISSPPCTGPLDGGTISGPSAICSGVSFTLTISGGSFGTGLTYQWESSANGTTWTPISGATNATYTTSQTATTYYRRKMTCSGVDEWSTSLQVTLNPVSSCYCPVTFPSNVEPITLVNFANINNSTSAAVGGTPALENFTSITGNVSKGQTYSITVKGNTDGNFTSHVNVFIDWNQDGDFVDAGESYYLGTIVNSTGTDAIQVTGNILIPATALDGITRMRVIKKYSSQAVPCNTTGYGQAEDYTLSLTTPVCNVPTSISIGSITVNSASVSFTASGTVYVEYGPVGFTPGTGVSAGAGTVVSGPSPIALTGLATNTVYDVYVRQDCGGGIFSNNASAGNFRTLCGPITSFPFTETFETASISRSCWIPQITSGTYNWTYGAGAGNGGVTTAHGGSVNARFFGEGYGGETARLISPELNLSGMTNGADLSFWMVNPSWAGDINELRVYYKTSAGGSWTLIPGAVYTTSVGSWTKVEIDNLPNISSTYYIAFEGTQLYGYGIGIDDVVVSAAPTCRPPKQVSVLGTTSTTANVYFTSPGNAFIVEYGPVGFTPGTGNTAGVGGALVLGTSSPITVPNLTASTTYDFYIRQVCVPGTPGDYSANVKVTGTTLCPAVNIPYLQNFESAAVPGMPTCTSVQDVNGNSGSFWFGTGGGTWETYTDGNPLSYVSPSKSLLYWWDENDATKPADDWFFTQGLNLTAGTSYRLKFFYKGIGFLGIPFTEKLEVKYGPAASAGTMTSGTLYTNNNILTIYSNPFDSVRVDFTPTATGVYYLGFHANSDADKVGIMVDDISVKVAPVVDAGVSGLTAIPTCPASSGVIQATVRNYNLTTLNFATYPVTVTANISGASTGSINTVINTGTLAPGASMSVALPAFNYITGTYNITVATSSPSDPETANDAYTTSFFVNPSPSTPVVTPSAPAICAGAVQQLSATSSGAITWSPITNLFTTSAANTVYIGEVATTVYAKPASTATYTATATTSFGCKATTNVTVTVNTNPVVSIASLPTKICTSDTLVALSATPAGGTWSGIGISGNNFIPSRAAAVGTYTLSYTSTNASGCTTVGTTAAKVESCPERIRLLRNDGVIVFPNPAIARFNIKVNSVLYNKLSMKIYNLQGDLVRTQEYSGLVYGRVLSVDISYMPAGTYMVHFSYDGGVRSSDKTFKVVVAH